MDKNLTLKNMSLDYLKKDKAKVPPKKYIDCRLTTINPDYQLGWAILAECRQLIPINTIFILFPGKA